MLRDIRQQEERQDMKSMVLGILAHVDAGKTTLSEALLYLAGSIRKMGRVDNRDAFLDTYALERARGITIFKAGSSDMGGNAHDAVRYAGPCGFFR